MWIRRSWEDLVEIVMWPVIRLVDWVRAKWG